MTRRLALMLACLAPAVVVAQGPLATYFTDPATELSWASCYVYLAGSRQKIPFLPLVGPDRAPLGTKKYTRDVRIDAPMVLVGDGIVGDGRPDPYDRLDVSGKVVLLAYDAGEARLEDRVRAAADRHAAAIVAFSTREDTPFPMFRDTPAAEIPAIVVGRRAAESILAAAGLRPDALSPRPLIVKMTLRIAGVFDRRDGRSFTFVFEPGIGAAAIDELAAANEQSIVFITDLFKAAGPVWRQSFVAYFRDFDSKVFYTHHWGRGLSSDAGVFSVFDPSAVNLGLAVHENTHTLLTSNWGGSSSFFNEGFARYAESMATSPERDRAATREFLAAGRLPPLAEMLGMNVGADPRTDVGYPAAGALVRYLVDTYGLDVSRRVWRLQAGGNSDRAWAEVFNRPLAEIEREWMAWLRAK